MSGCKVVDRCCFVGRGKIRLSKYDATCGFGPYVAGGVAAAVADYEHYPLIEVGNVSNFSLDLTVTTVEPPRNYMSLIGTSDCAPIENIDKVALKMTLHCANTANLAKALAGDAEEVAAATGVTQAFNFTTLEQFIPFRDADGNVISNVDIATVSGLPAAAVDGIDYSLSPNGIKWLATSTLALPVAFTATYDHGVYDQLQILMSTGGEYRLHFDGVNKVDGRAFAGELFRIKIRPGGLGSMISDEFLKWEIEATVLEDCCRASKPGVSPYGTFPFGA